MTDKKMRAEEEAAWAAYDAERATLSERGPLPEDAPTLSVGYRTAHWFTDEPERLREAA